MNPPDPRHSPGALAGSDFRSTRAGWRGRSRAGDLATCSSRTASARRDPAGTPRHGSAGPTRHGPAGSAPAGGRRRCRRSCDAHRWDTRFRTPDTVERPHPRMSPAYMCQQIMQALGRVTATNEALATRVANLERRCHGLSVYPV